MKRTTQLIIALCLMLLIPVVGIAKKKAKKQADGTRRVTMYVCGMNFSFNDSLVYFTDIQAMDTVSVYGKYNILLNREQYAYQLRNFMTDKLHRPNTTSVIVHDIDKDKLTKKLQKLRDKYIFIGKGKKKRPSNYDLRVLNTEEFKFEPIYQ